MKYFKKDWDRILKQYVKTECFFNVRNGDYSLYKEKLLLGFLEKEEDADAILKVLLEFLIEKNGLDLTYILEFARECNKELNFSTLTSKQQKERLHNLYLENCKRSGDQYDVNKSGNYFAEMPDSYFEDKILQSIVETGYKKL